MRPPRTPAERRAIELYDGAPRGDRVHVRVRSWTCPFAAIAAEVPASGRVLEVGCGHGLLSLLLALGSPARVVHGIDVDPHKIDLACRALEAMRPGEASVGFEVTALEDLPDERWDAVVMADVAYLLPSDARTALLRRMADLVAPGGVLVVKEVSRQPVWKWQLSEAQERLATRVLRITEGETVHFAPVDELAAPMVAAGLAVTHHRVDRGYPYAHHLFVGRREPAGMPASGPSGEVPS